ncbi:MAG: ATP synthase F1 subunit gamma [Phycisphaerae bacterium]|nr:ATP synthase F1 subunit gamma [Phycisphaerae bacterium]
MAGTRQILQRREAAENIGKVTHTMETVSAVRYRQYYRRWVESLEFYDALAQLAYLMVAAEQTIEHPLMLANKSDCQAVIVTGSNRGLCGAYNSNLIKLLEVHRKMAGRFGKRLKVYAQGNKILGHLAARGIETERVYHEFDEMPTSDQVRDMADDFIAQYRQGAIGRLSVVYTRFFSPANQKAQTLTILPVSDLIDDLTTRATVIWPWELGFEDFLLSPSARELFDGLATMIIRTALSGCFLDAALSEHLQRVIAMRSATDNAGDMIRDLTKHYNRARQGRITEELLDIIGGVEAMQ